MKIYAFLTAYALADDLLRCYAESNQAEMTWLLFLHSRRPDVVQACEQLASYPNVVYFPYGENRGMSRSINEAIQYAQAERADVLASINDDVLCPAARVQQLAQSALDHTGCAYVEAHGYTLRIGRHEPLGFSCCAWPMSIFERVGYFDENFHPFYFMDADWKRRALLLGHGSVVKDMPDVIHAGSKTLTDVAGESDWLTGAFNNTLAYYLDKWGGDQKQERYATPFNDPACGLRIGFFERDDPYPTHRPAFRGVAV